MTTPNIPAIRKVLAQIESDPASFDMLDWEGYREDGDEYWDPNAENWAQRTGCGTTRCAAGWAIYQFAEEQGIDVARSPLSHILIQVTPLVRRGVLLSYSSAGAEILGIDGGWFFREPDEVIGYFRELIAEHDARVL